VCSVVKDVGGFLEVLGDENFIKKKGKSRVGILFFKIPI
jgi:hypothetical protein